MPAWTGRPSLQELVAQLGVGVPEYVIAESGPDHAKTFEARVRIGADTYGHGIGRSKKEAEQQAAETAWKPCARPIPTAPTPTPQQPTEVPELPEVEVVRRGLADFTTGRTIDAVEVLHPRPVRRHLAGPDDFVATLKGQTFGTPARRGKYLWLPLESGDAVWRTSG